MKYMSSPDNLRTKPRILIFCDFYLPGYKSGGGLRSVVNMVERFKTRYDFRVVTRDNDDDGVPYQNVKIDEWNDVEGARVFYLSKKNIRIFKLRQLILETAPHSIYSNSFFSTFTIFLLTLRRLKLIPPVKIILAPEGELSDGALGIKSHKKKLYLRLTKFLGLYRNLIWKTTADLEEAETAPVRGRGGKTFIAPNLPSAKLLTDFQPDAKPAKKSGAAKLIFLSRFAKKKNFKWLTDNLKNIKGHLIIDVYGLLEDRKYWHETQLSIAALPPNIEINYRGTVEYEKVLQTLTEYHFFILPTVGENFGHVFIEALAAGCPLIISNRTPWLKLEEKGVGWDLPLESPEKWMEILNYCVNLSDSEYAALSRNAREFAVGWLRDPLNEADTLKVLQHSLEAA